MLTSKPDADWTVSASNASSEVIGTGLPSGADPAHIRTRICSVSKPIVASAIVLAGREQPGALDRPVIDYLPELRDSWRIDPGITLTHLLGQTSGIAARLDHDALVAMSDDDGALARCAATVVAIGQETPPGEVWRYCNDGYWLAGAVLERLRGSTLEDAVNALVLDPAGMVNTGFDTPAGELPPTGPGPMYPRARRASGGLWSTVPDIMRFAGFLYDDPDLLRQMSTTRVDTGEGAGYGLGLFTFDGLGQVGHPGDWNDFYAFFALAPAHNFATVALAQGERAGEAAREIGFAQLKQATGAHP